MYGEGYGNHWQAARTLAELEPDSGLDRCSTCPECTARCVHGVDIGKRVAVLIEAGYRERAAGIGL
jgi:heterodisulfide reductase subunit C